LSVLPDLRLSAEIGQSLLAKNEELVRAHAAAVAESAEARSQRQHIEKLFDELKTTSHEQIGTLERKLRETLADAATAKEELFRERTKVEKLASEAEFMHQQVERERARAQEAEQLVERILSQDRAVVMHANDSKAGKDNGEDGEAAEEAKWDLDQWKARCKLESTARVASEKLASQLATEKTEISEALRNLEAEVEALRTELEYRQSQMDELAAAVADGEEARAALVAQLNRHPASGSSGTAAEDEDGAAQGGKTLLGEIEDRRKDAEERHASLSDRHKGLLRDYKIAASQRERMRRHIACLAQLSSSSDESSTSAADLARIVANQEEELKRLRLRLSRLESGPSAGGGSGSGMSSSGYLYHHHHHHGTSRGSGAEVDFLRAQVSQQAEDLAALRKELRTSEIMRMSDASRVRELQSMLKTTETDLKKARALSTKLQFDLEEFKSGQRAVGASASDTSIEAAAKPSGEPGSVASVAGGKENPRASSAPTPGSAVSSRKPASNVTVESKKPTSKESSLQPTGIVDSLSLRTPLRDRMNPTESRTTLDVSKAALAGSKPLSETNATAIPSVGVTVADPGQTPKLSSSKENHADAAAAALQKEKSVPTNMKPQVPAGATGAPGAREVMLRRDEASECKQQ
jgi:chromosome segregation ATPase